MAMIKDLAPMQKVTDIEDKLRLEYIKVKEYELQRGEMLRKINRFEEKLKDKASQEELMDSTKEILFTVNRN
jgi:hypothetical protein